jgi:hypothetical protein
VSIQFVPPRVALTDPATGLITREWYLFFQSFFGTQGSTATTMDSLGPVNVADMQALGSVGALSDEMRQVPAQQIVAASIEDVAPVSYGVIERMSAIEAAVEDIKKGLVLL